MTERENINLLYRTVEADKSCPHGEIMDSIIERQEQLASGHKEFTQIINAHMKYEDEFKREMTDRFKAGDDRMANIETEVVALNRLVDAFEGFRKSLHLMGKLAGVVLLLFMWILLEKNADIKATQDTLLKHSIALEKMVQSHQELEKDMRREFDMRDKRK